MKRAVITGIKHYKTGIRTDSMNIAQMNIHTRIEKRIFSDHFRLQSIIQPFWRYTQWFYIILFGFFHILFPLIGRQHLTPQITLYVIYRKIHPTSLRVSVQILGIICSMMMKQYYISSFPLNGCHIGNSGRPIKIIIVKTDVIATFKQGRKLFF